MAKFTPGPTVAAVSGSIGGTVYSRNKGGAYIRNRAIPTNPNTLPQQNRRADLAALSQAWADLTDAQRASWLNWAQQNPRTDALGQSFNMSGQQSYISLNARIREDGGTIQVLPPIINAPDAFLTLTQTFDIGTATFEATFTPVVAAGQKIQVWAAVVNSAGISYVTNLYRNVGASSDAEASPYDAQSLIEARLGAMVAGQTCHIQYRVYDVATGLVSPVTSVAGLITDTP